MLPAAAVEPLRRQLERVKALHERDVAAGYGAVYLPDALARKYPNAAREFGSSPRPGFRSTRVRGRRGGIMRTSRSCSERFGKRRGTPGSPVWSARIVCATALRRTYWQRGMTFARFRSFSAMRM
jgi:hypothetical protein